VQNLKENDLITIDSDNWNDLGVTYKVVSYTHDFPSSAINLVLDDGIKRTVPYHWIKKVKDVSIQE
jgi:hypothetical protein